jgi:hypothetical protein
MSQHIHSANYESFYLDYLEGNLNEQATAELLLFLKANPSLVIADSDLVSLPTENDFALADSFVSALKMNPTEIEVNESTIEWFLIASLENQLTENQAQSLEAFLLKNTNYLVDKQLYIQTKFSSDKTVVYPFKQELHKGKLVPMFFRISAIAASLVVLFTVIQWNSSLKTARQLAVKPRIILQKSHSNPASDKKQQLANSAPINIETGAIIQTKNTNKQDVLSEQRLDKIAPKRITTITHFSNDLALVPMNAQIVRFNSTVNTDEIEQPRYASLAMANPIKPITEKIGEVINQEVDFKTTKAAHKKAGGFYLKIGKLEISRKVYDQTALALK